MARATATFRPAPGGTETMSRALTSFRAWMQTPGKADILEGSGVATTPGPSRRLTIFAFPHLPIDNKMYK